MSITLDTLALTPEKQKRETSYSQVDGSLVVTDGTGEQARTLSLVKRDTDGVAHVEEVWRAKDGSVKIKRHRADRVALYLKLAANDDDDQGE